MDVKKIMMISIAGLLISVLIFGGTLYFTVFKNSSAKKNPKTYVYEAGEFSSNLGDMRRFFKGKITIETTDKKLPKKFEEKNIILRDGILSILIEQDSQKLVSEDGFNELKQKIIDRISQDFNTDKITNIYFSDYIVQ